MRGFFCALIAGALLTESVICAQETQTLQELQLYAQGAVLMDADSGRVLYGKNDMQPMAMASTTKIMTCILILENTSLEEEVPVSAYASGMPKVKLYIKQGEHYTVRDLLHSLMLESHNDAAAVLAEYAGAKLRGEEKEISAHTAEESKKAIHTFAETMNEKSKEIGCEDTWFITPNGLDATESFSLSDGTVFTEEHHTTARDLARILRYCIKESPQKDNFLKITRMQDYAFTANGRSFQCHNHNALLQMMDGALTGKTGFTNKAGYCYVGALEKDGKCFIVALLACGWPNHKTYKWSDSRKLLEYGMENYHYRKFSEETFEGKDRLLQPIPVTEAQNESLETKVLLSVRMDPEPEGREGILMTPEEKTEILYRKEKELTAPVTEGEVVGEICYLADAKVWRRERLLAAETVEAIDLSWCGSQVLKRFLLAIS